MLAWRRRFSSIAVVDALVLVVAVALAGGGGGVGAVTCQVDPKLEVGLMLGFITALRCTFPIWPLT